AWPGQPIHRPPRSFKMGLSAVARPPELGSAIQPSGLRRTDSGRRFETTMSFPSAMAPAPSLLSKQPTTRRRRVRRWACLCREGAAGRPGARAHERAKHQYQARNIGPEHEGDGEGQRAVDDGQVRAGEIDHKEVLRA